MNKKVLVTRVSPDPQGKSKPVRRWLRYVLVLLSLTVLSGALISCCSVSLTPLPPEDKLTRQNLLDWTLENGIPGSILLIAGPDHTGVMTAGTADVKTKQPLSEDHKFRIGSITKLFIGVVAAQMHAEGLLDLDSPISTWLDDDVLSRIANSDRITLRQLLNHTSGVHSYENEFGFKLNRGFLAVADEWTAMRELEYSFDQPALFEPGQGWSYSNTGYILAGLVLSCVSGHHFSQEIRRRTLDPLGLENTYFETKEPPAGELAHGYEDYFNFWRMDTRHWTPIANGAAGMVSSASDLSHLIRAIWTNREFLDEKAFNVLMERFEGGETYSLGMNRVRDRRSNLWFYGHSGAVSGYFSLLYYQPDRRVTIAYFGSSTLYKLAGNDKTLNEFHDAVLNAGMKLALQTDNGI